jgi:hypothetical protein
MKFVQACSYLNIVARSYFSLWLHICNRSSSSSNNNINSNNRL